MRGSRSRWPRLNGPRVVLGVVFRTGDKTSPLILNPFGGVYIRGGEGGRLKIGEAISS